MKDILSNGAKKIVDKLTGDNHTRKDAWVMLSDAVISVASQVSNLHHLYIGYDLAALQKTDMLVQYVMFMYHNRDTLDEYKPDIMIRRKESLGRLIDRSISDRHITIESLIAVATVNNDYERITYAVDVMCSNDSKVILTAIEELEPVVNRAKHINTPNCGVEDALQSVSSIVKRGIKESVDKAANGLEAVESLVDDCQEDISMT